MARPSHSAVSADLEAVLRSRGPCSTGWASLCLRCHLSLAALAVLLVFFLQPEGGWGREEQKLTRGPSQGGPSSDCSEVPSLWLL